MPQPPRISKLLRGNPLKDVLDDARAIIRAGTEEMRNLTNAFHIGETHPPSHIEQEVARESDGETACLNCVRDHLSTVASVLGEATS